MKKLVNRRTMFLGAAGLLSLLVAAGASAGGTRVRLLYDDIYNTYAPVSGENATCAPAEGEGEDDRDDAHDSGKHEGAGHEGEDRDDDDSVGGVKCAQVESPESEDEGEDHHDSDHHSGDTHS